MADIVVEQVDDHLVVRDDRLLVPVDIDDPVERLLRRGDVVAVRGEHDDGRANVAKIEVNAFLGDDAAPAKLVADEELADDGVHLLGVHEKEATPPAFRIPGSARPRCRSSNTGCTALLHSVLAGFRFSKFDTRWAPSNLPFPRSLARLASHFPPSRPPA